MTFKIRNPVQVFACARRMDPDRVAPADPLFPQGNVLSLSLSHSLSLCDRAIGSISSNSASPSPLSSLPPQQSATGTHGHVRVRACVFAPLGAPE